MAKQSSIDHSLFLVIVALLAWVIPGAGHFVVKERTRAVIIFITITLILMTGLYIGSIGVIDPVGGRIWYVGQMAASPAVGILGHISKTGQYETYGKPFDIGQIYTCIAGMLNLLCIISAVYMAYAGRGEMIGTEEDDA